MRIATVILLIAVLSTMSFSFDRISFFGGKGSDVSIALAIDSSGNRIIAGNTLSYDLPTTANAYRRFLTPGESQKQDGFIAKYGKDAPLTFATYFGSSEEDYIVDIEVGPDNTIWVAGHTKYSVSFPYTNTAHDSIHSGGYDIFVSNFSEDGSTLLYSTLLGGTGDDFATSLAVSPTGEIAIGGYSRGSDVSMYYPTSGDAISISPFSDIDGIVTVLRRDGSIRYSSYLGGLREDYVQDVAFMPDGNGSEKIVLAYYTKSTNVPMPADAFDPIYNNIGQADYGDGMIQIIDLRDGQQHSATYLGGEKDDIPYSISIGSNILIGGSTSSRSFPTSNNAWDSEFNGGIEDISANIDGFVAELSLDLRELSYSSFLGGNSTDRIYSVNYDKNGQILYCGHSSSNNSPVTGNAYKRSLSSKFPDIMTGRISASGRRISYGTLLGDIGSDIGYEIESDAQNKQVIAGISNSTELTLAGQLLQPSIGSRDTNDALVAELSFPPFSDKYYICRGDSVLIYADHQLTGNITYNWFPKTNIINDQTEEPTVFPTTTTTYTAIISDGLNDVSREITVNVFDAEQPEISGPSLVFPDSSYVYSISNIDQINPDASPDFIIDWIVNGGEIIGNKDLAEITVKWLTPEAGELFASVSSPNGCISISDLFEVDKDPREPLKIIAFGDITLCNGDTVVFDGGSQYYDFLWNTGNQTRFDTVWKEGTYSYTARKSSDNSIYKSPIATVNVLENSAKPVIRKQGIYLRCLFAANSYQWYGNGSAIPGAINPLFEIPSTSDTVCYYVEVTIANGCENQSDEICITPVSVEESASNAVLYPNPAQDLLIFKPLEYQDCEPRVYNLRGELMKVQARRTQEGFEIKLNGLAPGSYFLSCGSSDSTPAHIFVVLP